MESFNSLKSFGNISFLKKILNIVRNANEEKIKNIFITPILCYAYLESLGWKKDNCINFLSNIEFEAGDGRTKCDILFKKSKNNYILVEVKKVDELNRYINNLNNPKKLDRIYKGSSSVKLKEEIEIPSILLDSNNKIYNLDGDILGQTIKYTLNYKNVDKIDIIITSACCWVFISLNNSKLNKMYEKLKNSSYIAGDNEDNSYKVLNISNLNILNIMEILNLTENLNLEKNLKIFLEKIKNLFSKE